MPLSKIDSDSLNSGAVTSAAMGTASVASTALASGVPTRAQLPAGTVLQVVRNSQPNNATSTSATLVTVLSASITPSSASSKILVIGMSYGAVKRDTSPMFFYITLRRSSTAIGVSNSVGLTYSGFETANVTKWVAWQDSVIDEPASTSSLSYNIAIAHTDGQYGGYSPAEVTVGNSVLILMEIAA
jgi:hypothetical protein